MPFPPPPPPPPGPPPPPVPNFAPAAQAPASPEGRNLLLQSIRQGTTLKKTVTNDKSGPVIPGSGSGRPSSSSSTNTSSSGGSSSPRSNGSLNGSATLGRSNGLAGLFAGGMPKLKPTGVDIGQTNTSQSLTSLPSATGLGKQDQTRRQFNVDIKNRGPPPKPPPANQKPNMPQAGSFLEMRAKLKTSDRQKSFSSDRLNSPVLYRPQQQQLSSPSTPPAMRARPLSTLYSPQETSNVQKELDRNKSFSSDKLNSPALYRPLPRPPSTPSTPSTVRARPISTIYSHQETSNDQQELNPNKSFSSDKLNSPVLYRSRPPSTPNTPSTVRARPVSSYHSPRELSNISTNFPLPPQPMRNSPKPQLITSSNKPSMSSTAVIEAAKSPSAFQNQPLSLKNFPNAKTPPTLRTESPQRTPLSPSIFKFPPPSNSFGTFPARIPQVTKGTSTTKAEKPLSKRPVFSILPAEINKPAMYQSPPLTPSRSDYNRFRDAGTTNSTNSSNLLSPALPTSPKPKPPTMSLLSKPTDFKIQRPQLSVAVDKEDSSSTSTSDSVLTGPLHNRSNSTTSLNTNNSWSQMQTPQPIPKVAMKAPPGGYGKPNVAPKPPGIAAKSPGKLVNGRTSVTRAQSMRAPRSPPVAPPTGQMSLLPNQSDLYRGAPTFHQSQDSLLHAPPPPKHHTLPSPRAPPSRPPLRPPQTRPPPPPPNRLVMSPPCPPPPPPTQAPPPPPHRVPLPTHRIPPVPASLSPAPPPPPARHSSMRNGLPPSASFSSKLEARFAEKFHVKEEFPPPQTFLGVTKVYNSRTSKQPAPQPPPHVQLHWPQNNSSTC